MSMASFARLPRLTQGLAFFRGLMRARTVGLPWLLPGLPLLCLLLLGTKPPPAQAQGGTWSPTGNMTTARFNHTATRLANGKVLVAGGNISTSTFAQTASAELYDPATGTWNVTGSMNDGRIFPTASLLNNGHRYWKLGASTRTASLRRPSCMIRPQAPGVSPVA